MLSEKLRILRLAAREWGLPTDRHYFPPSNKGEVKHLIRKGFLVKLRSGSKRSKTSFVHLTPKGQDFLRRHDE